MSHRHPKTTKPPKHLSEPERMAFVGKGPTTRYVGGDKTPPTPSPPPIQARVPPEVVRLAREVAVGSMRHGRPRTATEQLFAKVIIAMDEAIQVAPICQGDCMHGTCAVIRGFKAALDPR